MDNIVKGTFSDCLRNTFRLEKFACTRREVATFSMHFVINPIYGKIISSSSTNSDCDENKLGQAAEWGLA